MIIIKEDPKVVLKEQISQTKSEETHLLQEKRRITEARNQMILEVNWNRKMRQT